LNQKKAGNQPSYTGGDMVTWVGKGDRVGIHGSKIQAMNLAQYSAPEKKKHLYDLVL